MPIAPVMPSHPLMPSSTLSLSQHQGRYQWVNCSHQFSSVTQSYPILCNSMDCSTPGFLVHHKLPEFAQTHVHRVGDAIQPSHSLLSLSPPAFNLAHLQGLIQWVSYLHQVAKYWSFSFSSSNQEFFSSSVFPMNIQDWFSLGWTGLTSLQVQGSLKGLLQHHSSKASILQCSVFIMDQLLHPYMTTGKNHSFE